MLEIKNDEAEAVILKVLMLLESKVNSGSGMSEDETKSLYNVLLHEVFGEEKRKHFK